MSSLVVVPGESVAIVVVRGQIGRLLRSSVRRLPLERGTAVADARVLLT